ncbi:MAG: nucleoside triphosphate pyrophosphohydrolase [Candidatus Puniceispirillaceae bacterium]
MSDHKDLHHQVERIYNIMKDLRDPQTGCPWDIEQNFETIAPYTIEEAYEVSDAIYHGDREKLADELGDLLLQVVFHAQMAEEEGSFTLADVARRISDKMIRRHPHVFGNETRTDAESQTQAWEDMKAQERSESAPDDKAVSVLDDIAVTLPAMVRAAKLQKRAARVGFDWPHMADVIEKMREETGELLEVMQNTPNDIKRLEDEVGDILFVASNIARKAGIDPETALMSCNRKFEQRFRYVEQALNAQGRTVQQAHLEEMEALWQEAKATK